jgi:hypothetical protein
MAEFTVQPKLRPIAKDDSPPEGLTIDYGGTIWLNFDGVVLCLQFEPPDALMVGGCLLKYASGFLALGQAEPAGSG